MIAPPPETHLGTEPTSAAPCPRCTYWMDAAIDALIELQGLRLEIDADRVEFVAQRQLDLYRKLGGTRLGLAEIRHEVRSELAQLRAEGLR